MAFLKESRTLDSTSDLLIIAVIKGSRYSSTSFSKYVGNGSSSQDYNITYLVLSGRRKFCQRMTFKFDISVHHDSVAYWRCVIINVVSNGCNFPHEEITKRFGQVLIRWTSWQDDLSFMSHQILSIILYVNVLYIIKSAWVIYLHITERDHVCINVLYLIIRHT